MTVTIGWWIVPLILTIGFLIAMFWPEERVSQYDFVTPLLRLLWIVPILLVWLFYFMGMYFFGE